MAFVLTVTVGAFAQPGRMPQQVILTARATSTIQYGGPTRAEGRSYNFTPVFFIYPDGKLDKAGAEALLQELDICRNWISSRCWTANTARRWWSTPSGTSMPPMRTSRHS